jgi:hypothetical protein
MEAAVSSEALVTVYRLQGRHISEGHNLNIHYRENVTPLLDLS